MSVTPNLSGFNKDKVANKFGIQLKKKENNQSTQSQSLSSSTETNILQTKSKTINEFSSENQSNGFISKSSELLKKPLDNSIKSKSTNELISTSSSSNERSSSSSLKSNIPHSTNANPVKLINSSIQSDSQSFISTLTSKDRSKSPSPSPNKRTSMTTTTTKTEAEIEHQKDQPLYKRQPSKPLDNPTSMTNRIKQLHESSILTTSR